MVACRKEPLPKAAAAPVTFTNVYTDAVWPFSKATLLTSMTLSSPHIVVRQAESAGDLESVRTLFREYATSLDVDLCFQNFEDELRQLPGEYASPQGALWVAIVDSVFAGCCAVRPLPGVDYVNASEMKRLYVRPQFRGLGLGRQLSEAVLDSARAAGFDCILLDTLDDMEAARALYQELGFAEIPPYYYNPIAGAHYLKADLGVRSVLGRL
jgi:putative acetyltransferase